MCAVQVMGGVDSAGFKQFEELFVKGFYALQRHADGLGAIVQVTCSMPLYSYLCISVCLSLCLSLCTARPIYPTHNRPTSCHLIWSRDWRQVFEPEKSEAKMKGRCNGPESVRSSSYLYNTDWSPYPIISHPNLTYPNLPSSCWHTRYMMHDTVILWRQKAACSRQLESEVRTFLGLNCLILHRIASHRIALYSIVLHSWLKCKMMRNRYNVTWVIEREKMMYWKVAWYSSARNSTLHCIISQNLFD